MVENTRTMKITTQDQFSDYEIKMSLGVVRGNTVRCRNVFRNILATIMALFGGEIVEWTKMIENARNEALARMIKHAKEMGADAVVGVRFTTATIDSASEMLVYGTAVKLK